jgi:hypothetical protein
MSQNSFCREVSAAIAVVALFVAQAVSAAPPTITLGYGGAAQGDPYGGGEFLVTGSLGSFNTFCLEYSEHFSPGGTYFVNINTGAVNGGISTAGTYAGDVDGTASFDPLSNATAWLYTQYRSAGFGGLTGFSETTASQTSLQLAIWKLEGELSSTASAAANTAYNNDTIAQGWVGLAIDAVTNKGWTNTGNVGVMNLYTSYSNGVLSGNAQDQLYYTTPVPEAETYAMLLAGLGLMGFVARRRTGRDSI